MKIFSNYMEIRNIVKGLIFVGRDAPCSGRLLLVKVSSPYISVDWFKEALSSRLLKIRLPRECSKRCTCKACAMLRNAAYIEVRCNDGG